MPDFNLSEDSNETIKDSEQVINTEAPLNNDNTSLLSDDLNSSDEDNDIVNYRQEKNMEREDSNDRKKISKFLIYNFILHLLLSCNFHITLLIL